MIDHSELLPEGREIGGFRIEKPIGHGNMGIIYRAIQINLNRPVALKVLFKSVAKDQDFVRSFFREAQAAAAFSHQNIVQAFDVGQSEDGVYYFAMELIEGGDISQQLKIRGKYEPVEALKYIVGIADGLDYGSSLRELTHGDIKPANIMITKAGKPKLADLGLARMGGEIQGESDGIMLTPLYAAPEMINGTWKVGDPRADMYSVGATLYHMMSGQPPFYDKDYNKVIQMHLKNTHVSLNKLDPPIPSGISKLVDKMLEKNADDRFKDWAEAKTAIEQAIKDPKGSGGKKKKKVLHYHDPASDDKDSDEQAGKSRNVSSAIKRSKSRGKKKSLAPLVILLVVVGCLVGGFLFMMGMKKDLIGDEYATLKETFEDKSPENIVRDISNFIDVKKTVPDIVHEDLKKYQVLLADRSLFHTSSLSAQKKAISDLEKELKNNPDQTTRYLRKSSKNLEYQLDAPGKKNINKNGLIFHAPFNDNGLNHATFYQPETVRGKIKLNDGMINKCAEFRKSTVSYGDLRTLRFGQASSFTMAFWLKPSVLNSSRFIRKIEAGDGKVDRGYSVSLTDGMLLFELVGNKGDSKVLYLCEKKLTQNKWEHVCITFSEGKVNFQLNGATEKNTSNGKADFEFSSLGPFILGSRDFFGGIDDLRIWKRCLSNKEINELFTHKGKTELESTVERYYKIKLKAFRNSKEPGDDGNPPIGSSDVKVHIKRLQSNFGTWESIADTIASKAQETPQSDHYDENYLDFLKNDLTNIKKLFVKSLGSESYAFLQGAKIQFGEGDGLVYRKTDDENISFSYKHPVYGPVLRKVYWDENESGKVAEAILKALKSRRDFPYDNRTFCALAALTLEPSDVESFMREALGSQHIGLMKKILEDRK